VVACVVQEQVQARPAWGCAARRGARHGGPRLRGGGAPVVRCSNAVNGLRAELLSAKEQEMHWGAYSGSGSGWNAAQGR